MLGLEESDENHEKVSPVWQKTAFESVSVLPDVLIVHEYDACHNYVFATFTLPNVHQIILY